jgi:hypothetical protein
VVWACGCGPLPPKPVDLATGERSYKPGDYARVVSRWTRHARLQRSFDRVAPFDTALDVRATFEAWDWRWAFVERYADYYQLPEEEKSKLRASELEQAQKFHEFHVAGTASRYEWTDFINPKNTTWRIVLRDDAGHETEPADKVPVRMPLIAETAFFPYVGSFDQPFLSRALFRFPTRAADGTPTLDPSTKHVTLRFSGPLGTVDLIWQTVLARATH